jgi:hypothetical protein
MRLRGRCSDKACVTNTPAADVPRPEPCLDVDLCTGCRDHPVGSRAPVLPSTRPELACDCEGPVHECRVPELNKQRLIKATPLRRPEPAVESLEERARAFIRGRYPHLYDLEGDLADLHADGGLLTSLLSQVAAEARARALEEALAVIEDEVERRGDSETAADAHRRIRALRGTR